MFDVSHKRDVYGAGKSYNIFAGKDGSKGLGKSSLKPEDAVSDYSDLAENERKVLDDWETFFKCVFELPLVFSCVFEVNVGVLFVGTATTSSGRYRTRSPRSYLCW